MNNAHTISNHLSRQVLQARLPLLDSGMCYLKFEKADGTIRTMLGTRCPRQIPGLATTGLQPEDKHGRLVVWDCEAQSYRSFIVDRLLDLVPVA